MGYTHYWRATAVEPDREAYGRTLLDAKRIVEEAINQGIRLAGPNGKGEPELTEGGIRLNGVAPDEDYESFWFNPVPEGFSFCKTREPERPYDAVVTAILLAAQQHYGDAIAIASDGDWDDWKRGRVLYTEALGIEPVEPRRL